MILFLLPPPQTCLPNDSSPCHAAAAVLAFAEPVFYIGLRRATVTIQHNVFGHGLLQVQLCVWYGISVSGPRETTELNKSTKPHFKEIQRVLEPLVAASVMVFHKGCSVPPVFPFHACKASRVLEARCGRSCSTNGHSHAMPSQRAAKKHSGPARLAAQCGQVSERGWSTQHYLPLPRCCCRWNT